jgi:hypothetical protein
MTVLGPTNSVIAVFLSVSGGAAEDKTTTKTLRFAARCAVTFDETKGQSKPSFNHDSHGHPPPVWLSFVAHRHPSL